MWYTDTYISKAGAIALLSDGEALCALRFVSEQAPPSSLGGLRAMGLAAHDAVQCRDVPVFAETRRWLDLYFGGTPPTFQPQLQLHSSEFRMKVWQAAMTIPFGCTVSYSALAERVGCRSPRAVGSALGANPILLIVPCHRVVGRDGSAVGYAGGVEAKRFLLRHEQAI